MKNKLDFKTKVIFYFVDEKYRDLNSQLAREIRCKIDWKAILKKASKNRVIFYFSKKVLEDSSIKHKPYILKEIVRKGEIELKKLRKTLEFIKHTLDDNVEYLVIKSEQYIPHITYDIDLLFKNEKDLIYAIKLMRDKGAIFKQDEVYKGSIFKNGLIKIELHQTVSWFGMKFFDKNFLWKDTKRIKIMDLYFRSVGDEANLGISLAHIMFDCQYITVRDFLSIAPLLRIGLNLKQIKNQACKYGWGYSFLYTFSLLDKLYRNVYSEEKSMNDVDFKGKIKFPYWLPICEVLSGFIEKARNDVKVGSRWDIKNGILLPILFYSYKRFRYHLPSRLYFLHSWLY